MPTYPLHCDSCGHSYEEFRSINTPGPEKCPTCGEPFGEAFRQVYAGASPIGLVYGSPTTVGQQADLNAKRLGKEQMQIMAEEQRGRTSQFTGKLPKGATPNTTGTGERPWFRDEGIEGLKPMDKPLDTSKVKDIVKYVETGEAS